MTAPVLTERTRLALGIVAAALALGVIGDSLLRVWPWGLNATLCAVALLTAGAALVRWRRIPVGPDIPWLALTIVLLGATFARRDSQRLAALDTIALTLTLGLAAASVRGVRVRLLDAAGHVRALVLAAFGAVVGSLLLVFSDVAWAEIPQDGRLRHARAVGLGALLALPLLLAFGALFAGADAVFANVLRNALAVDPANLFSHAVLILFWAALTGGYLRFALLGRETIPSAAPTPPRFGMVPIATALGLIDLLFLVFVVVQIRYLFGGSSIVQATMGLTYAEYARRGFFELVLASGLVLPLLLGADWLTQRESAADRRTVRQLSGLLLGLLAVVMASALQRMRLYVTAFGLSEARLYATAFMAYLALLCGWFAATVLRERRGRFAFGGLTLGIAALAGLHLLNPDAFIVRTNLARPAAERPFDAEYAASLSADAVPVLLAALPGLPPPERCAAAQALVARWGAAHPTDWRTWNWGRATARRLVHDQRRELDATRCPKHDS